MGDITGSSIAVTAAVLVAAAMCAAAALWTMQLIAEDLALRRLPDWLTLPAAGIAVSVCFVEPRAWVGLMWAVAYVVAGRGFGGGDVKLAVSLGIVLALAGGVGAVLAGMLLASSFTVAFMLLRRVRTAPHGPSMLASAWIVGLASTFMSGV